METAAVVITIATILAWEVIIVAVAQVCLFYLVTASNSRQRGRPPLQLLLQNTLLLPLLTVAPATIVHRID